MTASKCLGAALRFASLFPAIGMAADADGDGLDDAWQALWFIPAFDGANDYDGDGRINLVESINRSDPITTVDSGLGVVTITDVNPADGMDDHWQAVYSIASADALLDEDLDGRTAIEESIVFSNPHVADAPWQHPPGSIGTTQPTPSSFTLTLPQTIPTQRYRLQTCTDMVGWVDVPGAIVWATGAPITDTVDTTGDTRRFFRYIVDAPDGDADALDDWAEVMVFQTSITNADTDGDGWSDGAEAAAGADPADGGINPATTNPNLLATLVGVEFDDGRFYDWWTGGRTSPPEQGEEWEVTHGYRSFTGGQLIFPNAPSTTHSGAWTPPDLVPVPAFFDGLPWADHQIGSFDFPPDSSFTPAAFALRYSESYAAYKTNEWHMDWKRVRLTANETLPVDVKRDFIVTRRQWKFSNEIWVRAGAEETVIMTLTLPQGQLKSPYGYLTPEVPSNGGKVEYWVGVAEKGLTIYNGGRDPRPVTEADEETVGAFTVANRNDTDGDGTDDHSDNNVTGTGEGVEDEVDLMKLVITAPPAEGTSTVKLTEGLGRGVKLWETPTKGTEVPLNEDHAMVFAPGELPKIVYVEVTSHSASVRDIEFTMDFQPTNGAAQPGFDKVKATAIWAHVSGSKTTPGDPIWNGCSQELKDRLTFELFDFGPKYNTGWMAAQYTIGLEFSVFPESLESEDSVHFDITRQHEGNIWSVSGGTVSPVPGEARSYPSGDSANDDNDETDEDVFPDGDRVYSVDGPGFPYSIAAQFPELIPKFNFREYVRVTFGAANNRPSGNRLDGSRCSSKVDWFCTGRVIATPTGNPTYPETYQPKPGSTNEVSEGQTTISTPSP